MTDAEAGELGRRLAVLAEVLEVPMTPTKIAGYRQLLDDLPYADIVQALTALGKSATFFPKPAEIREQIRQTQSGKRLRDRMAQEEADRAERIAALQQRQLSVRAGEEPDNPAVAWVAKLREIAAAKRMPEVDPRSHRAKLRRQIADWREESSDDGER
jgi:hypothetical protein